MKRNRVMNGPSRTPKKYAGVDGYNYHPTKGFRKDNGFRANYKPIAASVIQKMMSGFK